MTHLKQIFDSLQKHEVKYLVCGGMAVNLYGIPRMTADIDLLIGWDEQNMNNFEEAIAEHGYKSNLFFKLKTLLSKEVRLNYVKEKNLIAYGYSSDSMRALALDVLVDVPVDFDQCWVRKEIKYLGSTSVYLLNAGDLIIMKEYSNREQDKLDIINLKKFLRK
jgi:hypothetical protein